MNDVILTCNAGSSTVKFALYQLCGAEPKLMVRGEIDNSGNSAHVTIQSARGENLLDESLRESDSTGQFRWIVAWLTDRFSDMRLVAAGHRIVHGGREFVGPVRVDDGVMNKLIALTPLAPLHQPHNLAAIKTFARVVPDLPQVACFDTAFHSTMPRLATRFALPQALTDEGVRRYGFHGLSYAYIASVLPACAGDRARQRVIVAHLGSGASLCAMQQGRSVATTMGFTALDGLPMAERCGDLDPGVLLYLMQQKGMDHAALSDLLYHQSGLLGVSGISGDMRVLEKDSSPSAQRAIELFIYRIGREIGSLAAALGGLDVLVFTGGIGENSARVRAGVCEQAGWLGVVVDDAANQRADSRIDTAASRVGVYVIATDENRVIARATQRILAGD